MNAITITFILLISAASVASTLFDEQVLEVMAQDGSVLSEPLIGYSKAPIVYLPLLDMGKVLGIRIEQSSDKQFQIFFDEDNAILVDISSCSSAFKLPLCQNFIEQNGVVYSAASYMQQTLRWPIDVDLKEMRIMVAVKSAKEKLVAASKQKQKDLFLQREVLGKPSAQVEVGYSTTQDNTLLGVYGSQPLLNHDSDFIYYKDKNSPQFRWTLSKQIYEENTNQLAPKSYSLVSTQTTEIKYLFSPTQISGFSVSNRRVDENIFDTHNLYEHGPPRWKAELFINGVYFGETVIDLDGNFSFLDVPLFYGSNRLIYRLTSPVGKVVEVTRVYDVSNEFAGSKRVGYLASFGQIDGSADYIGSAQVNYGLSESVSAQVGFAEFPFDGQTKKYSIAGLSYLNSNFTITGATTNSTESNESLYSIMPKFNLDGILISSEYTEFHNIRSLLINKIEGNTQVSVAKGSFLTQINTKIPTTIQAQFEQDNYDESNGQLATIRSYSMLEGASFLIEATKAWPSEISPDLYLELGEYLSFLRIRYGVLTQDDRYSKSKIALESNLPSEIYMSVTCEIPTRISESSYSIGLSRILYDIQVETNFLGSSAENSFNIILSTNIKHYSNKGLRLTTEESYRQAHINIHAFIDDNGNGIFDEDEKPYPNLKILHVQRQKEYDTDKDGHVTIPALSPYQRVTLETMKESITNIFLSPQDFTHDYLPTPGQELNINIPVTPSFDVTGTLTNNYYKKLVPLELLTPQGQIIANATSSASGHFKFNDISSGKYKIRVNPEFLKSNRLESTPAEAEIDVFGKAGIRKAATLEIRRTH